MINIQYNNIFKKGKDKKAKNKKTNKIINNIPTQSKKENNPRIKNNKKNQKLKRKNYNISNTKIIENFPFSKNKLITINKKHVKNRKQSLFNNNITENNTQKDNIAKYYIIKLNDTELNSLDYKDAIKYDKRTYFQYYLSLIKLKQKIIFTFYTYNDYNSRSIKICLFFFSFSLCLIINGLFFNDSTMHEIYEDKGKYNFIYQIPQILYSTIISNILIIIINFLSLTEQDILSLKNETKNINNKKLDTIKRIKIKIPIFFILIFLFLILFWYYISCFCAIYKNTQIHLIKDTVITYCLSLLYPFGIYLLPGIFRIPSLRSKKQDKQKLYKIIKIIQLI